MVSFSSHVEHHSVRVQNSNTRTTKYYLDVKAGFFIYQIPGSFSVYLPNDVPIGRVSQEPFLHYFSCFLDPFMIQLHATNEPAIELITISF